MYVLRSFSDGSFYKGYTVDLRRRLAEHNAGKSRYTSSRRPWEIVYTETVTTLEEAIERERYFKTAAGRMFIKTVMR